MMKLDEFLGKLRLAESCKTIYIKGCFGAPMNDKNKKRYTGPTALAYNRQRAAMINACSADTFGFDCICLIKAALGLWNADASKTYGGTQVNKEANGISFGPDHVPDIGADGIVKYLIDCTTDFSNIIPGECVWMQGHVGVYVGNGKVIECTPKWTNDVQFTNLGNIGYKSGNWRNWTKHGKLPWVDYVASPAENNAANKPNTSVEQYHVVVKGDTMSKIAKTYGTTLAKLKSLNPQVKDINKIYVGQTIRIK